MTSAVNPLAERLAGDSLDGLLTCRVNLHDIEQVRVMETGKEFIKKSLGSCVSMRLKHHCYSSRRDLSGCLKYRANFSRMMAVVVNHGYTPDLSARG